jgi:hypothetical protein
VPHPELRLWVHLPPTVQGLHFRPGKRSCGPLGGFERMFEGMRSCSCGWNFSRPKERRTLMSLEERGAGRHTAPPPKQQSGSPSVRLQRPGFCSVTMKDCPRFQKKNTNIACVLSHSRLPVFLPSTARPCGGVGCVCRKFVPEEWSNHSYMRFGPAPQRKKERAPHFFLSHPLLSFASFC